MRAKTFLRASVALAVIACSLTLGVAILAPGAPKAAAGSPAQSPSAPRFAVGDIVVRFTDHSRYVSFPGRARGARTLVTVIRYPATGNPSRVDVRDARPATAGPFPLVVFGHGFNITPAPYAALLQAWARAGYVVAAPIFPLTNANAPGGPDESDLVNQPADMSFVISRMLAASRAPSGVLSGLVDPKEIAVAGQSDGGSTTLAVAANRHYVDHRVRAAVILSGAEIPGVNGYTFPAPSPPLLATQGTADTSNAPASTYQFFRIAPKPKFLLSLLGAPHLGPYTDEQPQLGIVERETIAFMDRYLKHLPGARSRMWSDGNVPGLATLTGGN